MEGPIPRVQWLWRVQGTAIVVTPLYASHVDRLLAFKIGEVLVDMLLSASFDIKTEVTDKHA